MVLGNSGPRLFCLIPNWSTADLALGNIAVGQHCCYSGLILLQFGALHILRSADLSCTYLR